MGKNGIIVSISTWDMFIIHFLSVILGSWILFKRFARWIWNPKSMYNFRLRDNPPLCLVDTSLGQHKYVKLKGIKLHYVEAGARNKPLILLLHGFPDCWLSWRYQIPILSEYFRVVAVDLKGFGDSDKPLWRRSYRIDVILDEIKQLITALGVSSCTIIGHDLGGLLGWFLSQQSPDIVDKFIVVSCPHPNVYWQIQNSQWLSFIQLPYLPEMEALKEDIKMINDYYKHVEEKDSKDSYVEAYKYSFSRKDDWTGPINYFRNLPFIRICENSEQIKVSTVLITGNKDPQINLEGLIKSTYYLEKFKVKIIEEAGHFPHQENPDMFNSEVLKFLKVVPSGSKSPQRPPSKGLMDRMFGAVSTTVRYGNSVLDSVHKRTNGVVSNIPMRFALPQSNDFLSED